MSAAPAQENATYTVCCSSRGVVRFYTVCYSNRKVLIYLIKHCACFALVAELVPSGRLDVGGWFTGNALEVYEDPKYWCVSACFVLLTLLNKHQRSTLKTSLKRLVFCTGFTQVGIVGKSTASTVVFHVDCIVSRCLHG